jgi:PAS domain S-box-containing protein
MVGSHTDVSERRQLQEELQNRGRYQRALLDNFPFLVWLKDVDSRFLAVNQPFAESCGRTGVDDVMGKTDLDVWPRDLAEQYRTDDRAVLASREKKAVEEAVADHGERKWFETYKAPVMSPDGTLLGTVGFARDITDRKQAEAVARERTVQLDTLFTLSPDGFLSFDAGGRLSYANPAFERMTGLCVDEVRGLDLETIDTLLRGRSEETGQWPGLDSCRDPGQRLRLSLRRPRKLVLELAGVCHDGDAVTRVIYLRDITHQAEVERMKSEFLSVAAHELRTPMASIFGFTELLLHRALDEATRRELLETIHRQVTLLVDIINELLDLARIEARRGQDFTITDVELDALVRDTLAAFAPDPERWPLRYTGTPGLSRVRGDAGKLRQALTNILSNARKYSPDGGAIEVTLVSADAAAEPRVGISVQDRGIGMNAAQLARVFERFYRADTSGQIPGSGLGMSIVREIVELHGGEVQLHSQPGAGTRVTIWLPRQLPHPDGARVA